MKSAATSEELSAQAATSKEPAGKFQLPESPPRTDLKLQAHISLPDDDSYTKNDYCSKY